jgi:ankyrin repeat protein
MHSDIRLLELAIAHGDTAEVTQLLDAYPELLNIHFPENIGLTPLMWACRNRHTTVVELLLERGSPVNVINTQENENEGGNTALWFTAQGASPGTVPVARLLLDHGADIDTRCEQGTTAFYMAASWVHMELVQFLLLHGADPKIKNNEGRTALQQVRKDYEWLQTQKTKTEDMKRFGFRAPRMIAYLEKLKEG